MKTLSLKLKDNIFEEVETMVKKLNISRNAYINEALAFYNKANSRRILRKQLEKESKMVSAQSLRILREYEGLDDHLIP